MIVVASSTGGPRALSRVLPAIPRGLGAAVLVAQHMPAAFTASLARRLDALCALPVREAVHGEALEADRIYVAPGGVHLLLDALGGIARVRLDDGPALWGVRPAADHLFRSAAALYGVATIGVVLTGMGRDGAAGLRAVRDAGGRALVQDAASCVVNGMPQAALDDAGADRIASLDVLGDALADELRALPHAIHR